jgi:hypothetical protein
MRDCPQPQGGETGERMRFRGGGCCQTHRLCLQELLLCFSACLCRWMPLEMGVKNWKMVGRDCDGGFDGGLGNNPRHPPCIMHGKSKCVGPKIEECFFH